MAYPVIAIDGPSSSGKGTVAARVADILGWHYLDSGALYRSSALFAQQKGIALHDEERLAAALPQLPVRFVGDRIFLENRDVTREIRSEETGLAASKIAALGKVRAALLQRQRDFAQHHPLVADGRDMGSVVFPQACLKVFLTADAQTRAQRRVQQLGRAGDGDFFRQVLHDIEARDAADRARRHAPLVRLPEARLLDNSRLSVEESVKKVLDWYREIQK